MGNYKCNCHTLVCFTVTDCSKATMNDYIKHMNISRNLGNISIMKEYTYISEEKKIAFVNFRTISENLLKNRFLTCVMFYLIKRPCDLLS